MARERLIAGLDIGTTKTCAVLAADRPDGRLHLLAAGVAPSKGLKRGVVVNLEETSAAVQGAIEQCERIAGRRIGSAVVSIAGSHIESQNTSGVTTLAGGQDLSALDVQKALDSARAVALPPNREIIDVVPRLFTPHGYDLGHNRGEIGVHNAREQCPSWSLRDQVDDSDAKLSHTRKEFPPCAR